MGDKTFREMNLAVFERKPIDHVFFQPRFEPWVEWQSRQGGLPAELAGMDVAQVYDHIGASQRYMDYYTGQPSAMVGGFTDEVQRTVTGEESNGERTIVYHTPHGDLTEVLEWTVDQTWRTVEFLANSTDDLDALLWLVQRKWTGFSAENFATSNRYMADRGEGQFYIVKSPYMALAQQYMRYEAFIYALVDAPQKMNDIMRAIDDSYDRLFDELCASDVKVLNFGENLTEVHAPPPMMAEHVMPWYHKRAGQLRDAGIFTHIHIDGYFKSLLPMLADMPFDGLEALTPIPQGDVTLDEMAAHIGDKVLLDGIPAIYFLDHHPMEDLQRCCEELVARFPRLILGVSDEVPQAATEEGYRRLKWVADWAKTQKPAHAARPA